MKKRKINKELFKHNSISFLFASILSAILLFFFGVWIWSKTNNYDYLSHTQPTIAQSSTKGTVEYNTDDPEWPYLQKRDEHGNITDDFKVMCVGDLHLGHNRDDFTLEIFKRFLDKETPDLVVLNGDLIFNTTDATQAHNLCQLFEDRGQYWTFALGNHDPYSWQKEYGAVKAREIAFNVLCGKNPDGSGTQSEHCLAKDMLTDHNNGVGTHYINIKGKTGILQTLYMFDYYGIGYKNEAVLNWYTNSVDQIKTKFGLTSAPESMAFTHIPFYEMKHFEVLPTGATVKHVSGFKQERGSIMGASNGLVEAFLENNTTKVIFAHNHVANECYEISIGNRKLQMVYTLGIQYNCYSTRSFYHFAALSNLAYMLDSSQNWYIDGITNLYVSASKSSVMHHVFCQDSKVFDGLEHELYLHTHLFITYKAERVNLFNRIVLPILAAGCMTYYGFCIYFLVNRKKGVK